MFYSQPVSDFSRYLSITAIAIRSAIRKVLFSRYLIVIKPILLIINVGAETLAISVFSDLTGKVREKVGCTNSNFIDYHHANQDCLANIFNFIPDL